MYALRAGCLDLEIEIGRWRSIDKVNRICKHYNNGIEDESHFVFHCRKLEHIRKRYSNIPRAYGEGILCESERFEILCRKK